MKHDQKSWSIGWTGIARQTLLAIPDANGAYRCKNIEKSKDFWSKNFKILLAKDSAP